MSRLPLLALLVVVGGCGGESSDAESRRPSPPETMMLRLADLPKGFRYGDDGGCGVGGTTEGHDPELDEFLIGAQPKGCVGDFNRAWGGAPHIVEAAIFVFPTENDARRAWALRRSLFGSFVSVFLTRETSRDGEEVRFDSKGLNRPGAGVAWRDGRMTVVVYEEGLSGEAGRDFAQDLAAKQRRRIETPSDPDPVAEDDTTVALDDPSLPLPVYWLGERFEPAGGFPALELSDAVNVGAPGNGPGNELKLDYGGRRGSVNVDVWEPERWSRVKQTRFGRLIWDSPCARRSEVKLDGGRAEVYGGYSRGCDGEPDHWLAHAYFEEAVVTINMAYCYACGGRSRSDPYNSRQGMEAVVRGLHRR